MSAGREVEPGPSWAGQQGSLELVHRLSVQDDIAQGASHRRALSDGEGSQAAKGKSICVRVLARGRGSSVCGFLCVAGMSSACSGRAGDARGEGIRMDLYATELMGLEDLRRGGDRDLWYGRVSEFFIEPAGKAPNAGSRSVAYPAIARGHFPTASGQTQPDCFRVAAGEDGVECSV